METITLLNKEVFKKEEILKKMDNDDFYYGYLGKNALSSSSCKKLLDSPYAYHKSLTEKQQNVQALRDGQLIHLMVLEPHKVEYLTFTEGTKASKAYKLAVQEVGSHNVFTNSEYYKAKKIAERVRSQSDIKDMLEGSEYEVPEIGYYNGLPFRGKADILKGGIVMDLKTTSDLKGFERSANFFSYDLQAALYLELFKAYEFEFIVVDKNTLDVGIYKTSERFIDSGKRKLDIATQNYQDYLNTPNIDDYVYKGTL
jgi:hypothetical protein